jgi:nicotinamide-nucleotide amidase
MAEGALARSIAQVAVSCTGIAGPGGATPGKPVGLVHLACARSGKPTLHLKREYGTIGRSEVRAATVADALHLILRQAEA